LRDCIIEIDKIRKNYSKEKLKKHPWWRPWKKYEGCNYCIERFYKKDIKTENL
jgi:hypothetical protein